MKLFDGPGPRIFHIPAGADFAADFAAGLRARAPADAPPEDWVRLLILTNARRAARTLTDAIQSAIGPQGFQPEIRVLGEVGGDPRLAAGLPPAADPLVRRLRMTRIVRDILSRASGKLGPETAAPALADLVLAMVDELQEHGVDIHSLESAAAADHAAHWEISRLVLQTAQQDWRDWADAHLEGAPDPAERQRRAIDSLIAAWEADPPLRPIIAAGSTASRPGSARLLAAVARLPQGAVVLPGFDPTLDEAAQRDITPEHPQAAMLTFVRSVGLSCNAIRSWAGEGDPTSVARGRLAAEALRPAPVTDAWRANAPLIAAIAPEATAGLTLIEAPDARQEAEATALVIREALGEPGLRVALVTPDRTLARRVATELERFGVQADDSGGRPLALTPPGAFLGLLAAWEAGGRSGRKGALGLLALLKHPMCAKGPGRRAHLDAVRTLEIAALRRSTPASGFVDLRAALTAWSADRPERTARATNALAPLERIEAALAPVLALESRTAPLSARVAAHRATAATLSLLGAERGATTLLWADADGAEVLERLTALERAGDAYGEADPLDYGQLLHTLLSAEATRPAAQPHPRLAFYGLLEARMLRADRVILAGLDEGVWPETPQLDPWFSRPMRAATGLPEAERRLGLSAHDFAQGLGAPQVVLTRALKRDGAATVASRWVQRLTNLLRGAAPGSLERMRKRGERYLCIAEHITVPHTMPAAPRPAPRPPVPARPRRLPVTRIETLIRDPYAIYAERILRLRPLDPIGRTPDARERGSTAHKAVEIFARATLAAYPDDPWPAWRAALQEALQDAAAWPAAQALWARRLDRIAPWFLASEAERRAEGTPVGVEISGAIEIAAPAGPFTLTAKADRIDLIQGAGYAIYDYKTGDIPSAPQVAAFAKQLPLEAAIAEAGGFDGLPPRPAAKLAYLRLGGDGEEKRAEGKSSAAEIAQDSVQRFAQLVAEYDSPATPYASRTRPASIKREGDYDHLARVAEWSAGGGEEGEG